MFFCCCFSLLAWPGTLHPAGCRPPVVTLFLHPALLRAAHFLPLPLLWPAARTPFLHCDLCLHRNRIKPLSYCPDQLRRQVYCRHTLLELRGPWASPGTLSPSLPIVHQSPITIYPTDLPPHTSIHLHCQYLRPSYLCTFIGCSNPLISLLSLLTLTTSPLYYFQNHLPPKQIWNYYCPPSTLHGI